MIRDIDVDSHSDRREFLSDYRASVAEHGYPVCDPVLVYDTLDATFIRDDVAERGYHEHAQELQTAIDDVMGPVGNLEPERQRLGDFSEEELSIVATTQVFRESIGTFAEVDGHVRRGGDIANEFIETADRDEAHDHLHEFEDWYQEDLDALLANVEDDRFDAGPATYDKDEFAELALYNGLRMLLDRREKGDTFTTMEMSVP